MTVNEFEFFTSSNSSDVEPWKTVVDCYSALDIFFPACGIYDLTEGIYNGNSNLSLEEAQANQHAYLLDQAKSTKGSSLLEIGSGYGTLLDYIRCNGASGVGITISKEQANFCRKKSLMAKVIDYKAIPDNWNNKFDSVIANGSIEHFTSVDDEIAGKMDEIYQNLFSIVHRIINTDSPSRRFVTTVLHFNRKPINPKDLLKNPFKFKIGSDNFHYANLAHGLGGYYPAKGQLEQCAKGYFKLIKEVDGTEDYYLTSEEWLRRTYRALMSPTLFIIICKMFPFIFKKPGQFLTLLYCSMIYKSWLWQFKQPDPPTQLLRQTWEYQEK